MKIGNATTTSVRHFTSWAMGPWAVIGLTVLLTVVCPVRSHSHEYIHDTVANQPGYGLNAATVDNERHGAMSPMATSLLPLRVAAVFDQGDCVNFTTTCGHCTAVGQNVTNFQGSTATCGADDVLTIAKESYINDVLMPRTVAFLGEAFRYERGSGRFQQSFFFTDWASMGLCGL